MPPRRTHAPSAETSLALIKDQRRLGQAVDNAQVTVTTTAAVIIPARAGRQTLIAINTSAETVYLGGENVTSANGFPLAENESIQLDVNGPVYGVVAANTADLRWLEEL